MIYCSSVSLINKLNDQPTSLKTTKTFSSKNGFQKISWFSMPCKLQCVTKGQRHTQLETMILLQMIETQNNIVRLLLEIYQYSEKISNKRYIRTHLRYIYCTVI